MSVCNAEMDVSHARAAAVNSASANNRSSGFMSARFQLFSPFQGPVVLVDRPLSKKPERSPTRNNCSTD